MAFCCICRFNNVQWHAIKIDWRLQAIFRRAPYANWDSDIPRLIKAGTRNGWVTSASIDRLCLTNELASFLIAISQSGSFGAGVHRRGQASRSVAMIVEGGKDVLAHHAAVDGMHPSSIDHVASRDAWRTQRDVILPWRADQQGRAHRFSKNQFVVVRLVVRLHPKAILVVEDKWLICPWNLLISVEKRPHVLARPLTTAVVTDVACWIHLLKEVCCRPFSAFLVEISGLSTTYINRLIRGVIQQRSTSLSEWRRILGTQTMHIS
mmetsp:Transcript_24614/g.39509  ORF Transcript_24614/g.39509 Transcript_24614/m.39509 type:complete len:265 (+) Transcript_24614:263-1057(+)